MFCRFYSASKHLNHCTSSSSSFFSSSSTSSFSFLRNSSRRSLFPSRTISLTIGASTALTTPLLWKHQFDESLCESPSPNLQKNHIENHPTTVTIPSSEQFSLQKSIKDLLKWFHDLWKFLFRLGSVTVYFTPAIISAPLLLLNSPTINAIWWENIRYGIFCSGPCLTKLSQWIATRPDIFPEKLCKELEVLQTRTHEHAWEETVKILNQIYGPNWDKYLIIDHDSVAGSGLMAQVYHGYIHSNNPHQHDIEIALKILHPGVKDAIYEDLRLIDFMVHGIESTVDWLTYLYFTLQSPFSNVKEQNSASIFQTTVPLSDALADFKTLMASQVNFHKEAEAMLRFKKNFSTKKWQHRVKFAEPIDLHYYLQTGHYYPSHGRHSPSKVPGTPTALQFPLKDDSNDECSGILIQTFEHGIPMANYLTESKAVKETQYTNTSTIPTNKQRKHRTTPTINGAISFFHQPKESIFSGLSVSAAEYEIHESHSRRDKEIAELGLDLLLKMLFEDNFIHGDLHPGNLLLSYDTSAPTDIFSLTHQPVQLTVLDTGICTELHVEDRKNLILLLKYVIEGDGINVARLMMEKSRLRNPHQVIIDPEGFEQSMKQLLSETFSHGGLRLANNGVTKLLNEVLVLCYKHRVRLESGFSSIMLSIGIVEGLGIQLDPEIDIISRAAPFILKSAARDFGFM